MKDVVTLVVEKLDDEISEVSTVSSNGSNSSTQTVFYYLLIVLVFIFGLIIIPHVYSKEKKVNHY